MTLPTAIHPANRTLIAYLDGELPPGERADIRAHAGRCDSCRRELDYMEADLDWFRILDAAESPLDIRPPLRGLGRFLSATRHWRKTALRASGWAEQVRA